MIFIFFIVVMCIIVWSRICSRLSYSLVVKIFLDARHVWSYFNIMQLVYICLFNVLVLPYTRLSSRPLHTPRTSHTSRWGTIQVKPSPSPGAWSLGCTAGRGAPLGCTRARVGRLPRAIGERLRAIYCCVAFLCLQLSCFRFYFYFLYPYSLITRFICYSISPPHQHF